MFEKLFGISKAPQVQSHPNPLEVGQGHSDVDLHELGIVGQASPHPKAPELTIKPFVPQPPKIPEAILKNGWTGQYETDESKAITEPMEEIHELAGKINQSKNKDAGAEYCRQYIEKLSDLIESLKEEHPLRATLLEERDNANKNLREPFVSKLVEAPKAGRIFGSGISEECTKAFEVAHGHALKGFVGTLAERKKALRVYYEAVEGIYERLGQDHELWDSVVGEHNRAVAEYNRLVLLEEPIYSVSARKRWGVVQAKVLSESGNPPGSSQGSTRSSAESGFSGVAKTAVTLTKAMKKTDQEYQNNIANIRSVANGSSADLSLSVRQTEIVNSIPGYLRGREDWKPWSTPREGFLGRVSGLFSSSGEAPRPAYVDANFIEAQKFGSEFQSIAVNVDVLTNLASSEKKLNIEIVNLIKSKTAVENYIKSLNKVQKTPEPDQVAKEIGDEIVKAEAQKKQIEKYLDLEGDQLCKNARKSARASNKNDKLREYVEDTIKTRVNYLKQIALSGSDPENFVQKLDTENLFHQAVSDVYENFVADENAQTFIIQFTRVVEELTLEYGFSKQVSEKTQTSKPAWDTEEYFKIEDKTKKEITVDKKRLDERMETTAKEIEKLRENLPRIEEKQKVDFDIRSALDRKLAEEKGNLVKALDSLGALHSDLQNYYISQATLGTSLSVVRTRIQTLLNKEDPLTATELLELIDKLNGVKEKPETALHLELVKLTEQAKKIIHLEKQAEYLNGVQKKHLEERESTYRKIYEQKHSQLEVEVEINNLRTRWLALQRDYSKQLLTNLRGVKQGKDTKKIREFEKKQELIQLEQNSIDALYGKSLGRMQVLANEENKRRKEIFESSTEKSKIIKTLLKKVYDSSKVEVDFQKIELIRQLVLNGMTSVRDTLWTTVTTAVSALKNLPDLARKMNAGEIAAIPQNLREFVSLLDKLDTWVLMHPLESQRFAGNLQHAYDVLQNKGFIETSFRRGSTENIVRAMSRGSKEHVASENQAEEVVDVMPPELIALLYVADWLPEMTRVGGVITGNGMAGVMAYGAATLVATPVLAVTAAAVTLGYAQAWAERKAAKVVTEHKEAEVVVSALFDGVKQGGNFKDVAKAVIKNMLVRDAMEIKGSLRSDVQKLGTIGAIQAKIASFKDWWNLKPETSTTEKAVFIGTQVVLPALALGAGIAGSILTAGTLPLVVAIGYGIAYGVGAAVSMFLASAVGHRLKYKYWDSKKREKLDELETQRRLGEANTKLDKKFDSNQAKFNKAKALYNLKDEEIEKIKMEAKDEVLAHVLGESGESGELGELINQAFLTNLAAKAAESPAGVSLDEKTEADWKTEAAGLQTAIENQLELTEAEKKKEKEEFVMV